MIMKQRADTLNSLLRGEISAVETYDKAIRKVGDDPRGRQLRQMRADHDDAAARLREHIQAHTVEEPSDDSGPWGEWARFVQGAANLFGNKAAMKSLKEGEEHGVKEYEKALEDESLTPACRDEIRSVLLPRTRSHIQTLDSLMDAE